MSRIAVIGGSGFAALPGFTVSGQHSTETPYGPPSGPISHGILEGGGELLFRMFAPFQIPGFSGSTQICGVKTGPGASLS